MLYVSSFGASSLASALKTGGKLETVFTNATRFPNWKVLLNGYAVCVTLMS